MSFAEIFVALFSIVIIDIVLGGDNAILIALASKNLPGELRKKAMFWGVAGAVAIRALLAAVALYILKIPLLQLAGGVLLVWIAVKLLVEKREVECDTANSLMEAIKIIIMADVVMGIDNVLAIAGAAHGSVWMVIMGLLISVPIIVWGSSLLLKFMDRYPAIIYLGAAVLAWTAGKMMVSDKIIAVKLAAFIPYYSITIPVLVLAGVLVLGYFKNRINQNSC
ncbi:TerC family protein [Syntrophomonas curvata]